MSSGIEENHPRTPDSLLYLRQGHIQLIGPTIS